jgi:hypothetical protein
MHLKVHWDRHSSTATVTTLKRNHGKEDAWGSSARIADFVDGAGELIEPGDGFRFDCGTTWARRAHRRMLFEAATPVSVELAARIEQLHAPSPYVEEKPRPP